MPPIALFFFFGLLIAAGLFLIWRYWGDLARRSPEEQEFDERMAALNERQANRISDKILAQPLSDEDAWRIMVQRGMRLDTRRRRPRRDTPARLPQRQPEPRRDRYGGTLSRRVDERRGRADDSARRRRDEE